MPSLRKLRKLKKKLMTYNSTMYKFISNIIILLYSHSIYLYLCLSGYLIH